MKVMLLQKNFFKCIANLFKQAKRENPYIVELAKSNNMISIAFWRSCGNRDSTISTGANRYFSWRKSLFKLAEIFGGTKLPIPLWITPTMKSGLAKLPKTF